MVKGLLQPCFRAVAMSASFKDRRQHIEIFERALSNIAQYSGLYADDLL